jgi:hypothetical protein
VVLDWRCGTAPALQIWSPEFKLQSHKKKKKATSSGVDPGQNSRTDVPHLSLVIGTSQIVV